jgi:response regulator NasT
LSGYLKVLLADSDAERAVLLEVAVQMPDVVIVDMARPDRDALDLRRVSADNPRPVVMFVDRDDRAFMEEAIAAGVSSYNVVNAAFPDVKPVIMAAVAIFRKHQHVAADLQQARTSLLERETIDRAKTQLINRDVTFAVVPPAQTVEIPAVAN